MMEGDSHGSTDHLLVREAVLPPDAPDYVRRSAGNVLANFGMAWSDVSAVARIAPAAQDAETWLVAIRSDALRPGVLVSVSEGCWVSTASTQAFGSGQTRVLYNVHVAERASVIE